jgi:hypothetical protein
MHVSDDKARSIPILPSLSLAETAQFYEEQLASRPPSSATI